MAPLKIEHAQEQDFRQVLSVINTTISTIYPKYYPAGVVRFFLEHHAPEKVQQSIKNREIYILSSNGIVVGTGSISGNEIGRLFVLPQYQRQGYGKLLMDFLERTVLERYGSVTLDASLPAIRFYMQRGYRLISFESVTTASQDVLCYPVMSLHR